MSQTPILGIDLGTTFSSMAIVDHQGRPIIIPNSDGHPSTASVLHFYDREACVVGEEAVKMVVADPTNVARFIKRSMGEPDYSLEFFGQAYTPQELSALILRKLKEDAEEALGYTVTDAVITVPAYFNSAQRGATAQAGRVAGLNVLSIINEPTAAAIAYGIDRLGPKRRILVFDLGGGTFDVTLMQIDGIRFRTLGSDGNAELGGKDWDDRLVNYVAERFYERYGVDPRDAPHPYQELYERCLQAKIALTTRQHFAIPVNYKGHRMMVDITRDQFEALTRDLVDRCIETAQAVMDRCEADWDQIDEILLVGGSTRMPMIQRAVAELRSQTVPDALPPEESVALGAALAGVLRHRPQHPALAPHRQALARRVRAMQRGESAENSGYTVGSRPADPTTPGHTGLAKVRITDLTSHPLGVIVLDREHRERVVTLIPQGTPLPCEKRGRFAYAFDNMTAVRVEATEGHGGVRDDVHVIGEVVLDDLPPRPRGTAIEVVYRYGVDGILAIDVLDMDTGKRRSATIRLRGGMDPGHVEEARRHVAMARVT